MTAAVRISFEPAVIEVRLEKILPLRPITKRITDMRRYARIAISVAEVGVIEALIISRADEDGRHMLLDGHLRLNALRDLDRCVAPCIISTDDEAFTYNKRVNRLATVQEHFMIARAIDRGVPAAMIASALGIDEKAVMRRRNLLDGIAPAAIEVLKDRPVNQEVFDILRKMKPYRQTETAELMVSMNNFTAAYAKAILAATRQDDLAKPDLPKSIAGVTPDQMARMERELEKLTLEYRTIETTFGDDVLQLVLASRYLERLIGNENVASYLSERHPDIFAQFRNIATASSLNSL
jgi:ParB-like chromosome segregation protein Spo0J